MAALAGTDRAIALLGALLRCSGLSPCPGPARLGAVLGAPRASFLDAQPPVPLGRVLRVAAGPLVASEERCHGDALRLVEATPLPSPSAQGASLGQGLQTEAGLRGPETGVLQTQPVLPPSGEGPGSASREQRHC